MTLAYDDLPTPLSRNLFHITGYTFTGWNTARNGSGDGYADEEPVRNLAESGTVILYAQWKANEYTVVFDTDGGEPIEDVKVTFDSMYGEAIKTPVKTGYTFIDWIDADGNTIRSTTVVSIPDKHTLKATWQVNSYEVVFNGNKSTGGSMENLCMVYDKEGVIPDNAFTRDGYTFRIWNTASDGSGTFYKPGQTVINLVDRGTFTLYAVWRANDFTISFDSGEGSDVDDVQVTYGQDYGELPTPMLEGYTFDGWVTSEGKYVWSTSSVVILEDQTLTATWAINTYQVVFYGNGATYGTSYSQIFVYNTPQTLSPNTFYRTGYSFIGWNTMPDGSGEAFGDRQEVCNLASHDVTVLYAQWEPLEFTVHFDTDGGTGADDITVLYGQPYGELPLTEKEGYDFVGWFTMDGVRILSDTVVCLDGDITLHAEWTPSVIHVGNIFLNRDVVTMYVGQPGIYLIAVISPDDATCRDVIWSSSDENVVTVDGEGNLTANGFGKAVLTVTSVDGGFTAECTVLVNCINETVTGGELTPEQINRVMEQLETFDLHNVQPEVTFYSEDSESVAIPADMMSELVRQNAKVSIHVSNGSYALFTALSLSGIDFDSGTTMLFSIRHVTEATGSESQMIANGMVYDITLMLDGSSVTSFRESFTLALSYEPKEGEDGSNIRLFHLGVQGTEVMQKYRFNSQEDLMVFSTGHLSRYAIVYVTPADMTIPIAMTVAVILISLVLVGEITYFIYRKQKLKLDANKTDNLIDSFIAENWHGGPPEDWLAKPQEKPEKKTRRR